jgi:hypothetical protein
MENLKNSLNWFEIPVIDFNRAQKFYSSIYDFEMPTMPIGPNMFGFFLMEKGGVGGAIVKGEGYEPSSKGTLVYLNTGENLMPVLNRIEDAGGKVIMEKTLVREDIGFIAMFIDTEGNRVALHSMK